MTHSIEIWGGELDGHKVPNVGPLLRLPKAPEPSIQDWIHGITSTPEESLPFEIEEYELKVRVRPDAVSTNYVRKGDH